MTRTLTAAAAATLVLAGLALATPQKDTYNLTANLRARFEVPKPTGVPTRAVGLFTARSSRWRTTRPGSVAVDLLEASGRAGAAHVRVGRPGRPEVSWSRRPDPAETDNAPATITHDQLGSIRTGGTYVNVHTAKNAAGEIAAK